MTVPLGNTTQAEEDLAERLNSASQREAELEAREQALQRGLAQAVSRGSSLRARFAVALFSTLCLSCWRL